MATWNVSTASRSVEVESPNWLGALGLGLPRLGVPNGTLARLVCRLGRDGTAEATDPQTGSIVRVSPVARVQAPPPAFVMPASSMAGLYAAAEPAAEPEPELDLEPEEDYADEPTPVAAAVPRARPLEDRMFLVFDRCADIAAATTIQTACSTALTILSDLVPADAGAVLVRTRAGDALRFTAAFGPRANRIMDTLVPVDQGIAGFSHNFCMGLVIEDVHRDPRHNARVDRSSGYRTRALLAVPVKASDGASLGCMELLNPPERFDGEDLEVAQAIAGSLGVWLEQALG